MYIQASKLYLLVASYNNYILIKKLQLYLVGYTVYLGV